jgi:hypothetical protein
MPDQDLLFMILHSSERHTRDFIIERPLPSFLSVLFSPIFIVIYQLPAILSVFGPFSTDELHICRELTCM